MNASLNARLCALTITAVAVVSIIDSQSSSTAADSQPCNAWPAWKTYQSKFLSADGRVIDPSSPNGNTTSEGQSYALFFALVANDREGFDRILRWTINNLADGDLTERLPAWLWGKADDDTWGVLDSNAASDADLWIVYALAEAGRLWKIPQYIEMSKLLAERVLREETVAIPDFGRTLLPAPYGFDPEPGTYRLSPSYTPISIMRRFTAVFPEYEWEELLRTSVDTIVQASPQGFAPDWVLIKPNTDFVPDDETEGVGSYNAIRVYLWAGMLAQDDPDRRVLLQTLAPAALYVASNGAPPQYVNTQDGTTSGVGPAGFSASMLPFLMSSGLEDAAKQQKIRIDADAPLARSDNYYEQSLTLFGLGWSEGYYRFAPAGELEPKWTCVRN